MLKFSKFDKPIKAEHQEADLSGKIPENIHLGEYSLGSLNKMNHHSIHGIPKPAKFSSFNNL